MLSLILNLSPQILFILFFFAIITLVGIFTLRTVIKEDRPFTLLAAGMVCGTAMYIFILYAFSKISPGSVGIKISTIAFVLLGIYLLFKYHLRWQKLKFPNIALLILSIFITLIFTDFSISKMTTMLPSADSDMQWAYAGSFIKGNVPLMVPWQPDINARYHLGAYYFEGALVNLSNLPFMTIHTLINIFFLVSGSLLAIFILWETNYSWKNLWLIVAALVMFVAFGVLIIIYPNQNLIFHLFESPILKSLLTLPPNIPAKGMAGAALIDLDSLSFLPARSLSLALALLVLYFTIIPWRFNKVRIIFFAILLSIIAFVEESVFIPIFLATFSVFILSLFPIIPNLKYLKLQRNSLFIMLLLTSLLVILQGGLITNNLFSRQESAYHITLPIGQSTDTYSFFEKIKMLNNYEIKLNSEPFNWFFPSPIFFLIALFIYSYLKKEKFLGLIELFSAMSFVCFLLIEYKYSPTNNIRFYNFGNISASLGVTYLIFIITRTKSNKKNFILAIILAIFIFIPTIIPELIKNYQKIEAGRTGNLIPAVLTSQSSESPFEIISTWAGKNLPQNSRLISLDTASPCSLSLKFQYKGIYTICSSQYIPTGRPEPGTEFYDLTLTLNPTLFKQTKAEYLYIESKSIYYQQLPQFRKDELLNDQYFEILKSIDAKDELGMEIFYRLYKVKGLFLEPLVGGKDIQTGTLQELQRLIPKQSSIYIDDYNYEKTPNLSIWYRMALILALKDRNIFRNLSQTDYMAIDTKITYQSGVLNDRYDFYILPTNKKTPYPSQLIWSNVFASAWKRVDY